MPVHIHQVNFQGTYVTVQEKVDVMEKVGGKELSLPTQKQCPGYLDWV
jgi:hypothetical protein